MESLSGLTLSGYELLERLGSGGFGAVYRAFQPTIGREVAIKVILPGLANRPEFIRRFEIEAQIIARLEHPYIVPLYDYWRDPDGAYLVMRFLRGRGLQRLLRDGPVSLEETVQILDQVASALTVAHRNNVIHCDIKPGNILLDEDGNAYLADFGIARDLNRADGNAIDDDSTMGSMDYIAPEQVRGDPVTPRTDIYSLGVVLYEMLEGKHPFPGENPVDRMYKHINDPLPPVTRIRGDVGEAINDVIQKATAKDPALRYADAHALVMAFHEAAKLGTDEGIVEQLTRREQEVLRLISKGYSNKQIAEELFIEVSTVRWYCRQIYPKLGVKGRVQAILKARELNLIVDTDEFEDLKPGAVSSVISLPEPENPYKGLVAFDFADHRDFFGREDLTNHLIERLSEKGPHARFLMIAGPSGSGKSSLVKAGLIPALWRGNLEDSERWLLVGMEPRAQPFDSLEVALMRVAAKQAPNIHDQLIRDEQGLLRVANLILPAEDSELVIIIDQFEELFTLVEQEVIRQQFLDMIYTAVSDERSRVRVIVTLRADFYDRPLHYPRFSELVRARMETILPLTAQGLEKAITGPAERVGVKFEEGLVAKIVSEMSYQAGALPLLQFALTELFEHREGRVMTHAAYERIGGAAGALAKGAEQIYSELPVAAQKCTHQMFLRLITLGEGVEDTRRRAPRSELLSIAGDQVDVMDEVIDLYAESRLLTLDNDPASRSPTVEVAHEAVLREWERLREWLNESRDEIRLERQLARMAEEWRNANQDVSFLVRGSRLEQFEAWSADTDLSLTPREWDFLKASTAERDRQTAAEQAQVERESALRQRAQRVLQALVVVFLTAAVISGGLALWANGQRVEADAARDSEAEARFEAERQVSIGLASIALREMEKGNQDQAVLIALEALENYPHTVQAETALAEIVPLYVPAREFGAWQTKTINWSFDGKRIAHADVLSDTDLIAEYIRITDADSMEMLQRLSPELAGCEAYDLVWSPTGYQLAAIYGRGLYSNAGDCQNLPIDIWDTSTGERLLRIEVGQGNIHSVEWSPDGLQLLTSDTNGVVKVWDAREGSEVRSLVLASGVSYADWSPDGRQIVTGSDDGSAIIWDVITQETVLKIPKHTGKVTGVSWSPNGNHIATASDDGLGRVWDAETGELVFNLIGHTGNLSFIKYSPNSDRIVTASYSDGTVRIWHAGTGFEQRSLKHYARAEFGPRVSWSPDGRLLGYPVSNSGMDTSYIWDVSVVIPRLVGYTNNVSDGEWSPDGTLIATSSVDGTVRIWHGVTGEQLHILEHPAGVFYSAWSPDGNYIVTPCIDGVVRIWDANRGELVSEFAVDSPDHFLFEVSWSPDGSKLAMVDVTSHAMILDATSGEVLATLDFDAALELLDPDEDFCVLFGPAWSPDGSRLATGCLVNSVGTGPLIWDVATGELIMALEDVGGSDDSTYRVKWSKDGDSLISVHSLGTRLWDASTGELLKTYGDYGRGTYDTSLSPDETRIASGFDTSFVKIWDVDTRTEVLSFEVPGDVNSIDWSPDEQFIMVSGQYTVPVIKRVWSSTQALIDEAKACCVTRELTPEERAQFGLPARE